MIDCRITLNYFKEKAKMTKRCKLGCSNCPLSRMNNNEGQSCTAFEMHHPERAIKNVQRWSDTHPKETYLTKFMHNYPDAELGEDGVPIRICPHELGLNDIESCECGEHHCTECWGQPVKDGEEQ